MRRTCAENNATLPPKLTSAPEPGADQDRPVSRGPARTESAELDELRAPSLTGDDAGRGPAGCTRGLGQPCCTGKRPSMCPARLTAAWQGRAQLLPQDDAVDARGGLQIGRVRARARSTGATARWGPWARSCLSRGAAETTGAGCAQALAKHPCVSSCGCPRREPAGAVPSATPRAGAGASHAQNWAMWAKQCPGTPHGDASALCRSR